MEGEEVVLDARPHWVALLGAVAVSALISAGAAVAVTATAALDGSLRAPARWIAFGLAALLFFAGPARRIARWLSSRLVVTTERLIHRHGVIARSWLDIPLDAVSDVRYRQGVLERMLGVGDVVVEAAGSRAPQRFADVRDPADVQRAIAGQVGRLASTAAATSGTPASLAEEIERLADLRDRGLLSDEEYAAGKERLLGE